MSPLLGYVAKKVLYDGVKSALPEAKKAVLSYKENRKESRKQLRAQAAQTKDNNLRRQASRWESLEPLIFTLTLPIGLGVGLFKVIKNFIEE